MPDTTLLNFGSDFDVAAINAIDAKVALDAASGQGLRVFTGHSQQWPSIQIKAPNGAWDLSRFENVEAGLKNTGPEAVEIHFRVENDGSDGGFNCNNGSILLQSGESGRISVPLVRRTGGAVGIDLIGMRGYPFPQEGLAAAGTIDPARVTGFHFYIWQSFSDNAFLVRSIRATGAWKATAPVAMSAGTFFPFIDTFGQYIHRNWSGKIQAESGLEAARKVEDADLAAHPGPRGWDKYGGWQDGPALKATGYFRTEKVDGKWWMVDPDGHLFFSHGICCVNSDKGLSDSTVIEDRESWFKDFPGKRTEFEQFLTTTTPLMHHFKGRKVEAFHIAAANLLRKYGPDWRRISGEIAHARLRSWGMNTLANWSGPETTLMRRTPYTVSVSFERKPIKGSSGYWDKFPDPFDLQFESCVREALVAEAARTGDDPWCIGYFIDNEIAWGDDTSLSQAVLHSPPAQAAKIAFQLFLQEKHGAISGLNDAWKTSYASWDAFLVSGAGSENTLLAGQNAPGEAAANSAADGGMNADLCEFYSRIADQYFEVIAGAVRSLTPNHLYLGCRFAGVNHRAARAAASWCDVVSHNRYELSIAGLKTPVGAVEKPVLNGEFHFDALDRGMFHTGLVPCATQAHRAAAYAAYIRSALANPLVVGTHWFQYRDQPVTARSLDEENYQIGFVDICDTPYPEMVTASREVGGGMYEFRAKAV